MDSNLESIFCFRIINQNKKVMEYLSLYDYLGKAAGNRLGFEVAQAAMDAGVNRNTRNL